MSKLSEILNSQSPDQPIVAEVPIEMVFVPEGKKASFAKDDGMNQTLILSMEKEGLLQPIGVRWVSDERLEVVWGRRRLWAAKQLKWPTIMCHIGLWTEEQCKLPATMENLLRKDLTAVQRTQHFQVFYAEVEKVHGKNLGRKASGLVRARAALRDPVTKKFLSAPKAGQPAPGALFDTGNGEKDSRGEPATVTVAVAGSTPVSEAGTNVGDSPRGIAHSVAASTGKSVRTTRRSAALVNAFTKPQLRALGTCEKVTNKDLNRLAKIEDKERRALAINLICMGNSVDDAIAKAEGDSDQINSALEHRKEEALPDDDWVKIYCAKVYAAIEDPDRFRRAAILYRKTLESRAACAAKIRKLVMHAHENCEGKYTWHLLAFLCVCHPDNWTVCRKCAGLNKQDRSCDLCRGEGFEIKFEWPSRKK